MIISQLELKNFFFKNTTSNKNISNKQTNNKLKYFLLIVSRINIQNKNKKTQLIIKIFKTNK